MTYGEAHKTLRRMLAGVTASQPRELDDAINEAAMEKVAAWAGVVESSAQARHVLGGLQRPPAIGTGGRILGTDVPGYYRVLSIEASWAVVPPAPAVVQHDFVAVTPTTSDTLARMLRSWVHAPTNEKPVYVEYSVPRENNTDLDKVWEIIGASSPEAWRLTYLANPTPVDGRSKPAQEWVDFPKDVQVVILEAARRKLMGEQGDVNEYQAAGADENKSTSPGLRGL